MSPKQEALDLVTAMRETMNVQCNRQRSIYNMLHFIKNVLEQK